MAEQKRYAGTSLSSMRSRDGFYVAPGDGSPIALVPEGPFRMGRPRSELLAPLDATPARTVLLCAFLIDVEPVTNERFARFIDGGGYRDCEHWSAAGWAYRVRSGIDRPMSFTERGFDGPEQPAAGLSWFEAEAYAHWARKRLPTEAQWEKAARGDGFNLFPWGDDLPYSRLCNFNSNIGRTTRSRLYPAGASPYGCHDMAGNVNNWCRDWYWEGFYEYCGRNGLDQDPCLDDALRLKVDAVVTMRSDRGGGYATSFQCWEVLSCSGRLAWPPTTRRLWNGFRCVIDGISA